MPKGMSRKVWWRSWIKMWIKRQQQQYSLSFWCGQPTSFENYQYKMKKRKRMMPKIDSWLTNISVWSSRRWSTCNLMKMVRMWCLSHRRYGWCLPTGLTSSIVMSLSSCVSNPCSSFQQVSQWHSETGLPTKKIDDSKLSVSQSSRIS